MKSDKQTGARPAPPRSEQQEELSQKSWLLLLASWAIATIASLSALFIGEVMGQMPCLLCWYQRIFMFPLAILLTIALFKSDRQIWPYSLALIIPGLGFALYHSGLYGGLIEAPIVPCSKNGPSCTDANMTIWDLPLPYLSVAAFGALLISQTLFARHTRRI